MFGGVKCLYTHTHTHTHTQDNPLNINMLLYVVETWRATSLRSLCAIVPTKSETNNMTEQFMMAVGLCLAVWCFLSQ